MSATTTTVYHPFFAIYSHIVIQPRVENGVCAQQPLLYSNIQNLRTADIALLDLLWATQPPIEVDSVFFHQFAEFTFFQEVNWCVVEWFMDNLIFDHEYDEALKQIIHWMSLNHTYPRPWLKYGFMFDQRTRMFHEVTKTWIPKHLLYLAVRLALDDSKHLWGGWFVNVINNRCKWGEQEKYKLVKKAVMDPSFPFPSKDQLWCLQEILTLKYFSMIVVTKAKQIIVTHPNVWVGLDLSERIIGILLSCAKGHDVIKDAFAYSDEKVALHTMRALSKFPHKSFLSACEKIKIFLNPCEFCLLLCLRHPHTFYVTFPRLLQVFREMRETRSQSPQLKLYDVFANVDVKTEKHITVNMMNRMMQLVDEKLVTKTSLMEISFHHKRWKYAFQHQFTTYICVPRKQIPHPLSFAGRCDIIRECECNQTSKLPSRDRICFCWIENYEWMLKVMLDIDASDASDAAAAVTALSIPEQQRMIRCALVNGMTTYALPLFFRIFSTEAWKAAICDRWYMIDTPWSDRLNDGRVIQGLRWLNDHTRLCWPEDMLVGTDIVAPSLLSLVVAKIWYIGDALVEWTVRTVFDEQTGAKWLQRLVGACLQQWPRRDCAAAVIWYLNTITLIYRDHRRFPLPSHASYELFDVTLRTRVMMIACVQKLKICVSTELIPLPVYHLFFADHCDECIARLISVLKQVSDWDRFVKWMAQQTMSSSFSPSSCLLMVLQELMNHTYTVAKEQKYCVRESLFEAWMLFLYQVAGLDRAMVKTFLIKTYENMANTTHKYTYTVICRYFEHMVDPSCLSYCAVCMGDNDDDDDDEEKTSSKKMYGVRLFHCGHVFCDLCVLTLIKNSCWVGTAHICCCVRCPLCRKPTDWIIV